MDDIEVGMLDAAELPAAVAVLARGLRDNPLSQAVFDGEPDRRCRSLALLLGDAAAILDWRSHLLIARRPDGAIVGICRVMPPGERRPGMRRRLRVLRASARHGPRSMVRAWRWLGMWVVDDALDCTWRLGPLAVDAHLRGTGIGTALMRVACAQADVAGADLVLETDSHATVGFFACFSFTVIDERDVLGVPTWRMLRRSPPAPVVPPAPGIALVPDRPGW